MKDSKTIYYSEFLKYKTFDFIFRGLLACAGFFLVFGMTQTPDGVFVRPHPGKYISSSIYELSLSL
jgi:hypothetical protein